MKDDPSSLWRRLADEARPHWSGPVEPTPSPGFAARVMANRAAAAPGRLSVPGPLAWRAVAAAFLLSAAVFGMEFTSARSADDSVFPEPASVPLP